MSTTTVWSSNEHHSLSILTDRSRGHSAGSVYHPIDEFHRQICPTAIGSGRALFPNRQSY